MAAAIQERVPAVLRSIPKEAFADSFQKLYERCQAIILKANKVNLCVYSVLFVFWYHSPNVLNTPHICDISRLRVKQILRWLPCFQIDTTCFSCSPP
jgi:hypothetical protein